MHAPAEPSPDTPCSRAGLTCGLYHQMSPALHELGFFLSYERYPEHVKRAYAASAPRPRVLVAGVESEWSARALLQAIGGPPAEGGSVLFIDRCPTPLERIDTALGGPSVRTEVLDVEAPDATPAGGPLDLIVGDSFIKQFAPARKRAVLATLARWLKPTGILLLREYLGELPGLLDGFWAQLPQRIASSGRPDLISHLDALGGAEAFKRLHRYMEDVGSTYPDRQALLADLHSVGLDQTELDHPDGKPYVLVTARRTRPAPGEASA